MDVYKFTLGVLTAANGVLGYLCSRTDKTEGQDLEGDLPAEKPAVSSKDAREFQRSFFLVYAFVMAADWVQWPYLYALYKDEKLLSEPIVAALFATGFISAAISASFVGDLADRHGRKYACLCFCGLYSMSCLSMIFNRLFPLFLGRIMAGISTTLMLSVFETWMVAEYHARAMREKGLDLSLVFTRMTTLSSVVAICAGVVGQVLVDTSGTKVAPFMAALLCLAGAAVLIKSLWPENYGTKAKLRQDGVGDGTNITTILKDKRLISLGLVHALFEGTTRLFLFFWPAAIKSAHTLALSQPSSLLPPYGLVFATCKSAALLGSHVLALSGPAASTSTPITLPAAVQTVTLAVALAAAALSAAVQVSAESLTLWAFCLFEACAGVYAPSMGYLKGQLVHEGVRSKVDGLLRLPLNVFVVVTLILTQEGDQHRESVFLACSGLLIVAYGICVRYLKF